MKPISHKRLEMLGIAVVMGWLSFAMPVAWAGCLGVSVRVTEMQDMSGMEMPVPQTPACCVLPLASLGHATVSKPASPHRPAPAALPVDERASLLDAAQRRAAFTFIDTSPPPRPRPLRLYYAVFLK